MSCCGKKREAWLDEKKAIGNPGATALLPGVYFEYTGETGLTAKGPVTRTFYRFQGKGDRQLVDRRDASGLMAIPHVKRVRTE